MTEIDLNLINENFPIAGVTQSTQGFRDNFKGIKDNLGYTKTLLSAVAVTLGSLNTRVTSVEGGSVDIEDQVASSTALLELTDVVETNYTTLAALISSLSATTVSTTDALATQLTTVAAGTSAGTLALITTETTARTNADTALSTQITNLTSTVGANTSAISQEVTARTNADTSLSTLITNLEARTYPNPNLVYNPSFVRGFESWSLYSNTAGVWTVVNNGVWGDYATFNTSLSGVNYIGYQTDLFKVQSGQNYTAGLDISALGVGNGVVSFQLQWVNVSNAVISTTTATNATNGQGWTRYFQTNLAPVGATQARLRFFLQSTSNTEAMVRRVKVEVGTRATAFSDETTLGLSVTSLTSLINTEVTARTTQDIALATSITNLTTTVTTNNNTLTSAVNTEVAARTTADTTLATLITNLTTTVTNNQNSLTSLINTESTTRTTADETLSTQITNLSSTLTTNYNLLYNPSFSRGLDGWTSYRDAGVDWSPLISSVNGDVLTYTNSLAATQYNGYESTKFKVSAVRPYTVSLEANTQGMSAGSFRYQFVWYNSSSVFLSASTFTTVASGLDWTRSNLKITSPASAAFASIRFQLGDSVALVTNTSTSIRRIKVEQGNLATPFSDDSTLGPLILSQTALINTESTTRVSAISALSTQITNLTASTAASDSTIDARVTTESTARSSADSALSTLITNLTSTVSGNFSTLNSAINTEATTRTTQDTALGTLITNLTTTVSTNNTNLGTQITNETTARTSANATMGIRVDGIEARVATTESGINSVTSRVNTLESASSTSAEAVALRTSSLEAQMRSLGATRPHPTASWDFMSTVQGWTGTGGALAWNTGGGVTLTSNTTDPGIQSPVLTTDARITGSQFPLVMIEVENTGSVTLNEHILYYSTGGHGYTTSFYAIPIGGAPAIAAGARRVLVYDMRSLVAGGSDWTNNLITGLRYDPSNSATSTIKIWRAQALGFDGGAVEREVRAAITSEQAARVTATDALATQITNVSATLNPNPNMLYNSTFSLGLDGWSFFKTSGAPTGSWTTTPESASGSFISTTAITTGSANYSGYMSSYFPASANSTYTLSGEFLSPVLGGGSIRIEVSFHNAGGTLVGSYQMIENNTVETNWRRRSMQVTSGALVTQARVAVYMYQSTSAPQVSVRKIKLEQGSNLTAWSDEVTTGRSILSLGTSITGEITARTTADTTLGTQITNLTSTVGTNNTTITSRVATEETTRATETSALGGRATTIEARLNTNANLIKNPSAADVLKNWTASGTGTWVSEEAVVGGWRFTHSFVNATGRTSSLFSDEIAISPSSPYTLSGQALLAGLTSGSVSIHIYFYTSASVFIIDSPRTFDNNQSGSFTPISVTTPSNATKARIFLRLTSANGNSSASFSAWRLKLENGSVATPFTDDLGGRDLMARMTTADSAIIDLSANRATVTSVTSLTTTVNNNRSAYDAFVTLTSGQTGSLATRATNLETEITNARNGGANLSARLGTIEQSVTDINAGAIASRLTTLEAQFTGATGSALRTLILDETTARTTADTTLGNRTTTLESSVTNPSTPGGVLARLVTEETTRASADTGLATRATTLETTVNHSTTGLPATLARLVTEETTRASADTSLSNRATTLESTVNHVTTGLPATLARLVTEENTRASADTALSGRTTTLESSVNHGTTGLSATLARLVTEETTRSSADGALATRATTLESQMAGSTASFINSRIATEESARSTADTALSNRTTTLESTVNHVTTGLPATLARLVTEESTRATADSANATRSTTLESKVNNGVMGPLAQQNFDDGATGWNISGSNTFQASYQGRRNVMTWAANANGVLTSNYLYPVQTSRRYRVRSDVHVAAGSGSAQFYIGFQCHDAAGNVLTSDPGSYMYAAAPGTTLAPGSGWTTFDSLALNSAGITGEGTGTFHIFAPGTKFVKLLAYPNYNGTSSAIVGMDHLVIEDITDTVTGNSLSSRITSVETVTSNGTFATASRATALEAQFAGSLGSALLTRLGTVETVTSNGTFATASRATTLESQFAGTTGSALLTRLGVVETVTTNSTFATASSLSSLSSTVGGHTSSISTLNSTTATHTGSLATISTLSTVGSGASRRTTGFTSTNDGATSVFRIQADKFEVSDGTSSVAPLTVSGGIVYASNLTVGPATTTGARTKINSDGVFIYDSSGVLVIEMRS